MKNLSFSRFSRFGPAYQWRGMAPLSLSRHFIQWLWRYRLFPYVQANSGGGNPKIRDGHGRGVTTNASHMVSVMQQPIIIASRILHEYCDRNICSLIAPMGIDPPVDRPVNNPSAKKSARCGCSNVMPRKISPSGARTDGNMTVSCSGNLPNTKR